MRPFLILILALLAMPPSLARADDAPRSQPIAAVLREPLADEDLRDSERTGQIVIQGPTFEYVVDRATGAVAALEARRDGRPVVQLVQPSRLIVGPFANDDRNGPGETTITSRTAERLVLTTKATMRSAERPEEGLPYELVGTYYNDGVAVLEITILPKVDVAVSDIHHELQARGSFRHYLHKTRDSNGYDAPWASLPAPGESVRFTNLTSCLQVFSPKAGLAIFTDRAAARSTAGLDTAAVGVAAREGDDATVSLVQRIVHESPDGPGFVLLANQPFRFRVGLCVVPNRPPHRRLHDLRMFAWVGDEKHPYPTDQEIRDVAGMGFTLFQMHRLGAPGEPRPPAEELDRVLKTVHDAGMLFLWTANADLLYANDPGVLAMREKGAWPLWQGFNYGGRYTDRMDRDCDLMATCLASPNGLADHRVASDSRMLDRYDVDGMYIDDNLAYANCTLWREHGHPEPVYDCLIELHEMNWRRRQLFRKRRPHAVLIDHCARATVLPVICDFDAQLYAEGYTFPSAESYWAQYGSLRNMNAQGCLWPGGGDAERCSTEVAYNFDLLTGGGQYVYIDWRLYPEKFPYAAGVSKEELLFVRGYNLAQYGFGLYESTPFIFAESADLFGTNAPGTYATIYRNEVWRDHLVVLANMNPEPTVASLAFRAPDRLGFEPDGEYAVLDVNEGKCRQVGGKDLRNLGLADVRVPGRGLRLFYLRRLADDGPRHLWGGKRISERWDAESGTLRVELQGPPGAEERVLLASGSRPVGEVRVNGDPGRFQIDSTQRLLHGLVRFGSGPVRLEIAQDPDSPGELPEGPAPRSGIPAR